MVLLFSLTLIIASHIVYVENHKFTPPSAKILRVTGDPLLGYINVRAPPYNATGDGVTDDTNAIQRALNDVGEAGGGIVLAPQGNYLIASQLVIPAATVLRGVASHVQRHWGDPSTKTVFGTTLLAVASAGSEAGAPFISLAGDSSGVEGLQIFYPNQVAKSPPLAYPWTIQCGQKGMSIENVYVKNVLLVNSWKGIDAATYEAPRHWFENIYGQPLSIGIAVDQCYDIGRITHIHFWPFWSSEPALLSWVNNNGVTFLFERTDWETVEDVFSWGYQTGMAFRASAYGACNGQFTDINFDNVDIGIDISYTQPWGLLFSNLNLANAGGGTNRIGILGRAVNSTRPTDAVVSVRGASFWGVFQQHLVWLHPGFISMSDSLLSHWNETSPAVQIQRGRAMINNNYFGDKIGNAMTVSKDAETVTITGNHFNGNTLDVATKSTILFANNLA